MHMTPRNPGMSKRVVFIYGRPVVVSVPLRPAAMPRSRPVVANKQAQPAPANKKYQEPQILPTANGTAIVVQPRPEMNTTHIGVFLAFVFCIGLLWSQLMINPTIFNRQPEPVVLEQERRPNESWDQHVRRLIGMSLTEVNVANLNDKQVECLAKNIYFESRGQPLAGQVGVAKVTLNRVEQGWAKTVCGVVYQKIVDDVCQFSWVCNNERSKPSGYDWRLAVGIARTVLEYGDHVTDPTGGATHFHATYIQPAWKVLMTGAHQIGDHIFYRMKSKN